MTVFLGDESSFCLNGGHGDDRFDLNLLCFFVSERL